VPKAKIWNSDHRLFKTPLVIEMAKKKFTDEQITAILGVGACSIRSILYRARKEGQRIPFGPERKTYQLRLAVAKLSNQGPLA